MLGRVTERGIIMAVELLSVNSVFVLLSQCQVVVVVVIVVVSVFFGHDC